MQEAPVEVLYIQMEFCPTTLKRQLEAGPLEDAQRWRVVRQLLAALSYLHARGIIHRDIKPDNVFYDARHDVKLGDFGLAKFALQSDDDAAAAGALWTPPPVTSRGFAALTVLSTCECMIEQLGAG
jgi:serine/threonine protein kinase